MDNKGFTLVELLAVITIIALLGLLTGTAVTKVVKDTKEDLYDSQIIAIKSAAETWGADNLGNLPSNGECNYVTVGMLKHYGLLDSSITNPITNEEFSDDLKIYIRAKSNDYGSTNIEYEVNTENIEDGSCHKAHYYNGEVVYFDVSKGTTCTTYTESKSATGVKSGCMKFYAFNDNGGNTLNLLLDHNTTATIAWGLANNNDGPTTALNQLKTDTSSWVGTLTPSNYTIDQSKTASKAKYTINYSGYKARLITAEEVAKILGNEDWNITSTSSLEINNGWLIDRTSPDCKNYGCLNNSDADILGYWTSSASTSSMIEAWLVEYRYFTYNDTALGSNYGIRPVIEVSKSSL